MSTIPNSSLVPMHETWLVEIGNQTTSYTMGVTVCNEIIGCVFIGIMECDNWMVIIICLYTVYGEILSKCAVLIIQTWHCTEKIQQISICNNYVCTTRDSIAKDPGGWIFQIGESHWEVARESREGFSPIGILATTRVRDSPIWIQPREVFRINPTPGS